MLNILLLDDHPAVTEGTKLILEKDQEFRVTAFDKFDGLIEIVQQQHFDVMLFDLFMPPFNGIDLASEVIKHVPDACILIYTGFDIGPHLNRLIDAGLSGYVPKTSTREQLVGAIRCAMRREVVLPLDVFRDMRKNQQEAVAERPASSRPSLLERDIEILQQISQGKGNRLIAEQMCMSQRSLEYQLTHLFQKLGVKSRIEAVGKAKDIGILDQIVI
ncbi:response regulator transcription factor [Saccharibacillus kuerlensis]|uniref:DNA-binding response regulator n=1 Tax=Saccharibacillus kuerlensis TaxID=459527 RepID=A0ABQ2L437_9BACL|nr:response regulator transcription factor [Saccharibacillus kuerlensis]GGO01588.1 DNA-binding response regulator [Saccharibacillus kuerlensis]